MRQTRIGISGFGGVNFWMRRVLVQEKGLITDQEYLEAFALGQLIPGPNVFNVAVMIGHRFGGRSTLMPYVHAAQVNRPSAATRALMRAPASAAIGMVRTRLGSRSGGTVPPGLHRVVE